MRPTSTPNTHGHAVNPTPPSRHLTGITSYRPKVSFRTIPPSRHTKVPTPILQPWVAILLLGRPLPYRPTTTIPTMHTYPQSMLNSASPLVASFAGANPMQGTLVFPDIAAHDRKISVTPALVVWPATRTSPQIQDISCTLQQPMATMFVHSSSCCNRINVRTSCPECPRWSRSLRRSRTLHHFPHPCSPNPSATRGLFPKASITGVPLQEHAPKGVLVRVYGKARL